MNKHTVRIERSTIVANFDRQVEIVERDHNCDLRGDARSARDLVARMSTLRDFTGPELGGKIATLMALGAAIIRVEEGDAPHDMLVAKQGLRRLS